MAKQKSTFAKLQRDRAKAAKKAEREAARAAVKAAGSPEAVEEAEKMAAAETAEIAELSKVERLFHGKGALSAPELMKMVEEVSQLKQRGQLTEDEFEEAKLEIMERLSA